MEEAKGILSKPLALFVLPADAACTTETAAVELEAEDEHEGEHPDEAAHEEHAEESHTEFHGEYAITCASPADLGGIDFAFFDQFPAAEEIKVTVITETGQTSYEIERNSPRIDLRGLI